MTAEDPQIYIISGLRGLSAVPYSVDVNAAGKRKIRGEAKQRCEHVFDA